MKLRPAIDTLHARLGFWLKYMLERLGREHTLQIWHAAVHHDDDSLTQQILSSGWEPFTPEVGRQPLSPLQAVETNFPSAVEGVTAEMALRLIEGAAPISVVRERFDSLDVKRESTAYEQLHLRSDTVARLAETLCHRLGKQGELIAYDMVREERTAQARQAPVSAAEFLKEFKDFTAVTSGFWAAAVQAELVRASASEVVMNVRACEFAHYFRDRHRTVGYLMACSTDDADYTARNPQLRMQRTQTIMEGGSMCDFRVHMV
jgi:predicted hydrocarbon binding protein